MPEPSGGGRTPHKPPPVMRMGEERGAASLSAVERRRPSHVQQSAGGIVSLRAALDPMHPVEAVRELVHFLANRHSVIGCPMRLIQDEYHRFLRAKEMIQDDTSRSVVEREVATTALWHSENVATPPRGDYSPQSLRGDTTEDGSPTIRSGPPRDMEAVYVMNEAASSLKDVHSKLLELHESYRALSATVVAKDRRIMLLESELTVTREKVDVLQRGITSTHIVHASAVEDSDLLREAQVLNAQLCEHVAAFEDHLESGGGFVSISELQSIIRDQTREKESLMVRNSLFADKLLEADDILTTLRHELRAKTEALDEARGAIDKMKDEIRSLKDEVAHSVYDGATGTVFSSP